MVDNELPAKAIKCKFCPELKGLMKKVKRYERIFAHVACVNWLPEIYFNETKEHVYNLDKVYKDRKYLECVFCDIKYGACI